MKKISKKRRIVKVPSMRRFQEYLRRIGACSESMKWLKGRNFRTVREMYKFLADQCLVPERRWSFRDILAECEPAPWLRWLFVSPYWMRAGNEHISPNFGFFSDCDSNIAPPWKKVRVYFRFEVNRLVPLDWTPPEE